MEGETTRGRNDSGRNDSGRMGKWAKRPVTNLPWSREKSKYLFPPAPGFYADGIFILFMHFAADNIHLTDKISLHRTYWLVFIGGESGDINYFLPSIISVAKYTTKIQIPSAQKPGACWNESLRFFCCPKYLQKTAEPGKMRLGSFYKSTKLNLSYTFWLGWAMVLGSFQYRGVLLLLHIVGQGPAVLAAGAGRVGYIFFYFSSVFHF